MAIDHSPRGFRNKNKKVPHDEEYWARLKRDFERCRYQNVGAYTPIEGEVRSAEVDELRAMIRLREALYNNWRDHPTMEPKRRGRNR